MVGFVAFGFTTLMPSPQHLLEPEGTIITQVPAIIGSFKFQSLYGADNLEYRLLLLIMNLLANQSILYGKFFPTFF